MPNHKKSKMIKDRSGNVLAVNDEQQERFLTFLYNNAVGLVLLKLLYRRFISNLGRVYMSSRLSKGRIKRLIEANNIDMSEYEPAEYSSFNEFFIRKIKKGARPVDMSPDSVISPADSKLTVYPVTEGGVYSIKGCDYTLDALLGDKDSAKEFYGGYCFVYRLTVDNYHRYCYPDGGSEIYHRFIPGVLHTVNPIALKKHDVYGKNCRELTLLDTDNFGRVAYIEVGAMMVGRINNRHPSARFEKGGEKGYFSFGGSTIVLLYRADTVTPDEDIAGNSEKDIETAVKYGETVGKSA